MTTVSEAIGLNSQGADEMDSGEGYDGDEDNWSAEKKVALILAEHRIDESSPSKLAPKDHIESQNDDNADENGANRTPKVWTAHPNSIDLGNYSSFTV